MRVLLEHKGKANRLLGGFVATIITAILLYLSFRDIDWKSFSISLTSCNWPILILSAAVGALMPTCRALRWRWTVKTFYPNVKRLDSILTNYVGYLVNMTIPYTHEATRCVLMHHKASEEVSYDKLVGVAIIERACDALCILLLFIITSLLSSERYLPYLKARFATDNLLGTAVAIIIALTIIIISIIVIRKNNNKYRLCTKIFNFFSGIKVGLKSIGQLNSMWIYIMDTIVLWFIYWLQLYLGVKAMPSLAAVSAIDCLFLTLAVALSSIVPAPGGFGAFHFEVASALSTFYSIGWNNGIAYATLVHESQTIVMILIGIVSASILISCETK